jgi:hypothetical protein
MPSVTTWTRLEPRSRDATLNTTLGGQVGDPAWLLARQWQVGEFVGDDAGTPINAKFTITANPLSGYSAAGAVPQACGQTVLDALAGPESRAGQTLFDAAESGAELVRLLGERGVTGATIAAVIANNPLAAPAAGTADSAGVCYLNLVAGRLPDMTKLEALLRQAVAQNALPAALGVPAADSSAFLLASADWVAWVDGLVVYAPAGAQAWVDADLDYAFSVGVTQGTSPTLAMMAAHWDGERTDWFDLDADPGATAPVAPGLVPPLPGVDGNGQVSAQGLPAPLVFPGMPPRRWWQFDEGAVNYAQIQLASEDLARMLVVEFATVYANDWYLWPVRLPVGALHVVSSLQVTNTFGETFSLGPVGGGTGASSAIGDWCLFRSTVRDQSSARALNGLLLLPSMCDEQHSLIMEKVLCMRDETAGIAWAIEKTVLGADARPMERQAILAADPTQAPPSLATASSDIATLRYELATQVPAFWFPLVPDPSGAPLYDRLILSRVNSSGNEVSAPPAGAILLPGQALALRQAAVPPEGADIRRQFHMTRGVDGAVLVWCGRSRRAGFGAGSSGLRYDLAKG